MRIFHENEPLTRRLFGQVLEMAAAGVVPEQRLEFPFAALLVSARTDIAALFCEPAYPMSFLYPDLTAARAKRPLLRIVNPEAGFVTVSSLMFAAGTFRDYSSGQPHNWLDSAVQARLKARRHTHKLSAGGLRQVVAEAENLLLKQRVERLVEWYRLYKHSFFEGEAHRREIDWLIGQYAGFSGRLDPTRTQSLTVRVWDWMFREQLFGSLSDSRAVLRRVRHRLLSEEYFTNSMGLWSRTSFPECNSTHWMYEYQPRMKHQEHNSSCVFVAMRALNLTYRFVKEHGVRSLGQFQSPKSVTLERLLAGGSG